MNVGVLGSKQYNNAKQCCSNLAFLYKQESRDATKTAQKKVFMRWLSAYESHDMCAEMIKNNLFSCPILQKNVLRYRRHRALKDTLLLS